MVDYGGTHIETATDRNYYGTDLQVECVPERGVGELIPQVATSLGIECKNWVLE